MDNFTFYMVPIVGALSLMVLVTFWAYVRKYVSRSMFMKMFLTWTGLGVASVLLLKILT